MAAGNGPSVIFARHVEKAARGMATIVGGCVLFIPPTAKQEDATMQSAHLTALEAKHATLDRQIAAETQRPSPDQALLSSLKKRKLMVKQEMTAL
ncbi:MULTISPECIES: YdcH family protein [Sphingomonas]|uniref:YdcH family protein n=2 Tax=Sphingomonas TaxID=13687 RepID=UPI000AEE576D